MLSLETKSFCTVTLLDPAHISRCFVKYISLFHISFFYKMHAASNSEEEELDVPLKRKDELMVNLSRCNVIFLFIFLFCMQQSFLI